MQHVLPLRVSFALLLRNGCGLGRCTQHNCRPGMPHVSNGGTPHHTHARRQALTRAQGIHDSSHHHHTEVHIVADGHARLTSWKPPPHQRQPTTHTRDMSGRPLPVTRTSCEVRHANASAWFTRAANHCSLQPKLRADCRVKLVRKLRRVRLCTFESSDDNSACCLGCVDEHAAV